MADYPAQTANLLRHLPAVANIVRRITLAAGDAIMEHYSESGFHGEVIVKSDGSPVTIADYNADKIIREALAEEFPGIPMVTEETVGEIDRAALGGAPHYWLVDGLDGTKSFRRGSPDFTVNIGLIHDQSPVMGVIYAPALGEGFMGHTDDGGQALRWNDETERDHDIRVRRIPPEGVTLLTSTSSEQGGMSTLLAQVVEQVKMARHIRRNSSIKFCDIAAGRADIYTRFKENCFWDTAAGDAIVRGAGGHVTDLAGVPLMYDRNSTDFIRRGFIACNEIDYILPVFDDLRERNLLP